MAGMSAVRVFGVTRVVASMMERKRKAATASASISYGGTAAEYALIVHETHAYGGREYLRKPAMDETARFVKDVRAAIKRKESVRDVVNETAERIYNESQRIVPVDFGNLKGSGRLVYDEGS